MGLSVFKNLVELSGSDVFAVCHPGDSSDSRSVGQEFSDYCQKQEIEFFAEDGVGSLRKALNTFHPDVVLVCGWYTLIPAELLSMAPLGFFGIHNSLLPNYKGGSPLVWAMINGESIFGSTLFRLSPGIDDGPILHQVSVSSEAFETIGSLLTKIENRVCAEFPKMFLEYINSPWELRDQVGSGRTFKSRRPSDGLIDFSRPALEVCNFIHAQSRPYPGAHTSRLGKTIRIWSAHPVTKQFPATAYSQMGASGAQEGLVFSCEDCDIITFDWQED